MNVYVEKNLDSIINVSIEEAWLIIDVVTPHMPPSMPFVTDYVEYRRYETTAKEVVKKDAIKSDKNKIYEIESDIYSMNYMPNAIYIWVAPDDALVYGSGYRCFYNNTYAQLTGVEIDYGNLTKLCHKYDEKDLYLMALRNGLEDRTYADWTRTNKVFYHAMPDYSSETDYYTNIDKNEFFGVGSVLRMIPGIDIVSGGEQTLIGGMKITNETIKFHVKYRPLNITEPEIKYSLFVAFEYNGICTITPNFCDLAMIHIDSYNQIANAERAPRYRISRIYGKGLWDKTQKFFEKANNFAKKSKIISRTLGMIPHPLAKAGANALDTLGYGYGGSRSTRMRGEW